MPRKPWSAIDSKIARYLIHAFMNIPPLFFPNVISSSRHADHDVYRAELAQAAFTNQHLNAYHLAFGVCGAGAGPHVNVPIVQCIHPSYNAR